MMRKEGKDPGLSLRASLYDVLLEELMVGSLAASDRIFAHEIAEKFNVSQTPAREALMQLAGSGIINFVPRKGFHVIRPTPRSVRDLWEARRALERSAGEFFIEKFEASDPLANDAVDALEKIAHDIARQKRSVDHINRNLEFHYAIIDLADNEMLTSLFRRLEPKLMSGLVRRSSNKWRSRLDLEKEEHLRCVAALRVRDLNEFRKSVDDHLNRSLADALEVIETNVR